jgi:inositol-phosphate phosphatase/L-galactose 1-phosphate phosphatase/histidinol-phosphatase
VECKGDESPVTIADKAAEQAMRELINATCPEHGVFGEEAGIDVRDGEYVWVLDPIDGTKSFITGKPLFGTLIALVKDGVPVLGIIDQCILKERWVGVAGEPSTLNGKVITTKPCASVGDAYMYSTTPFMFEGDNVAPYNALASQVKIPMYGCDCYAYGLLAAGHCDLVVEADLKPYDFMALVPVIEGAGGVVTDWNGDRVGLDQAALEDGASKIGATEIIAACDASTHRAALDILQGARKGSHQ